MVPAVIATLLTPVVVVAVVARSPATLARPLILSATSNVNVVFASPYTFDFVSAVMLRVFLVITCSPSLAKVTLYNELTVPPYA